MDDLTKTILIYTALPLAIAIGRYIMKSYADRIDVLEREVSSKLDELEVRQLMSDKVDPINQNIQEIKQQLKDILNLLMKR